MKSLAIKPQRSKIPVTMSLSIPNRSFSERSEYLALLPRGIGEQAAQEKLVRYAQMLLDCNHHFNLISRQHRDLKMIITEHINDSLLALPYFKSYTKAAEKLFKQGMGEKTSLAGAAYNNIKKANLQRKSFCIADIGSGGGLPGIPLACVMPHVAFDLIESKPKKVEFLKTVVRHLQLPNVTIIPRAVKEIKHTYDIITARALGTIIKIYHLTSHLKMAPPRPTVWLLYKGRQCVTETEITAFCDQVKKTTALGNAPAITTYDLNSPTKRERRLVVLKSL
ncbi:ribosomal RNA small subunit methyltransferase G [Spirochaetota bacterium]|nr:ribosomal RNA small subunit methyltransferase G [Spirochaetota bacterium]